MITTPDKPEPQPTAATDWRRLEWIDRKIAELAGERAEIKARLEEALSKAV
jgi:hypothetical protein